MLYSFWTIKCSQFTGESVCLLLPVLRPFHTFLASWRLMAPCLLLMKAYLNGSKSMLLQCYLIFRYYFVPSLLNSFFDQRKSICWWREKILLQSKVELQNMLEMFGQCTWLCLREDVDIQWAKADRMCDVIFCQSVWCFSLSPLQYSVFINLFLPYQTFLTHLMI